MTDYVTESELEILRWYRSLKKHELAAIAHYLLTGDVSLCVEFFTHRLLRAA